MRTAGLFGSHAPKTAPAFDEITGIASPLVQPSSPAPQQSPESEPLRVLSLEDLASYVQFFSGTLQFAISPDAPKPERTRFPTCSAKRGSWLWASHRDRGNLVAPEPVKDAV